MRISTFVRGLSVVLISSVAFLATSCRDAVEKIPYGQCPTNIEGKNALDWLSEGSGRNITEILFLRDDLFVGTSTGLVLFDGSGKLSLFKCRRANWDSFKDLVYDEDHNALWAYVSRDFRLTRLDEKGWHEQPVPALPQNRIYTREEANAGFSGFNFNGEFYLQGENNLWKWSSSTSLWTPVVLTPMNCADQNQDRSLENSCFAMVTATDEGLFSISRANSSTRAASKHSWHLFIETPEITDIVAHQKDGQWQVINPKGTPGLKVTNIYPAKGEIFLTTPDYRIFAVDAKGIREIKSLGVIDAAAITYEGKIIVCFANLGIYEWQGDWVRRSKLPYQVDRETMYSVAVGAKGETIVVGFNPPDEDDSDWKLPPPGQLWIINAGVPNRLF